MKISSFDLNLFVIMNSIYTEGSLTKAAEVVGITQPAVSNALSRLREKFDDELFVRTGSGMVPTQKTENIVFLLWGNHAKKHKGFVKNKHIFLDATHPSPLGANRGGWSGCKHFSKTNEILKSLNKPYVDW